MEFESYKIYPSAGTELNYGPSEDSDPVGLTKPGAIVLVVGPEREGALPVRLIENGKPVSGTIYFHQSPK